MMLVHPPDIFTWITSTRFRTQSTVKTRRTGLVAIYTVYPGPTFLERKNIRIVQKCTIRHMENNETDTL